MVRLLVSLSLALAVLPACKKSSGTAADGSITLLNVSYDPTRQLYIDINKAFSLDYQAKTGKAIHVNMSHGGSGKQARSVLDGLEADVVTLALAYDVNILAEKGQLMPADWQKRLPDNSSPYTSTIVFVVRKGNPRGIKDWNDLIQPELSVVTPNPKTSGGARWNYLAAWGYALRQPGGNAESALAFVSALFKNVKILDTGARGATTTFAERNIGDVLVAWENEALLLTRELGADKYDIVRPRISILCEPAVALVDKVADRKKTRESAEAYLQFLYSETGQAIVAKHHFRPRNPKELAAHAEEFPAMSMFTVDEVFGGWSAAQKQHFDDGGVFDKIYEPSK